MLGKLNIYSVFNTPYLQMVAYESKAWMEEKFCRICMFIYSKSTCELIAVKCKKYLYFFLCIRLIEDLKIKHWKHKKQIPCLDQTLDH